jgi:hypothetical protein
MACDKQLVLSVGHYHSHQDYQWQCHHLTGAYTLETASVTLPGQARLGRSIRSQLDTLSSQHTSTYNGMLNTTECQYLVTKRRICYWAVGNKNISWLMNTILFQCQLFNDPGLQIATITKDRGFQFTAPFSVFTAIHCA